MPMVGMGTSLSQTPTRVWIRKAMDRITRRAITSSGSPSSASPPLPASAFGALWSAPALLNPFRTKFRIQGRPATAALFFLGESLSSAVKSRLMTDGASGAGSSNTATVGCAVFTSVVEWAACGKSTEAHSQEWLCYSHPSDEIVIGASIIRREARTRQSKKPAARTAASSADRSAVSSVRRRTRTERKFPRRT